MRTADVSVGPVILEHVFDSPPPGPETLADADDASVVAAIEEWARLESAAGARRLSAIAELATRRIAEGERAHWACDDWDSAAAEVSVALGVSHGAASRQMDLAITMRDRLPLVGARFLDGRISARLVAVIAARTDLVQDREALASLDLAIADRAIAWGPLSVYKLEQAIDLWVEQYDPAAVPRTRTRARTRDVTIGADDDESGITSFWGKLYATDAALLNRRLIAMSHGVCDDDPRTIGERRADAIGALAAGADHLSCQCDNPDCSGNTDDDGRATNVVIHVVAEQDALAAEPDPQIYVDPPTRPITRDTPLSEALAPDPEPAPEPPNKNRRAALIVGGGVIPPTLLAELIRAGAKVKPISNPCESAPEPRYIPSGALQEFVRARDLTCRFPGCDRPAEFADIDHTQPHPAGGTHPSNLKCLCRKHHLLKTFWTGWMDRQLADGTVEWTTPTGRTSTTRPFSRLCFPDWNMATGDPPEGRRPAATEVAGRSVMMPTRRRTRAQARADRIRAERELNAAQLAERSPPF